MKTNLTTATLMIAATTTVAAAQMAQAASVDITNSQGTISNQMLNSNGGLDSGAFATTTNNGVSLWLRVRDQGTASSSIVGPAYSVPQQTVIDGKLRIDFQFTPQAGDTLAGGGQFNNYQLMLQWDSDPTAGVSYATSPKYIIFDDADNDGQYVKSPNGDIDDRDDIPGNSSANENPFEIGDDQEELLLDGSWDDGDSLVIDGVTVRGGNTVDFLSNGFSGTLPEWVVVNSWKPEWIPGGGYTTPTDPGLYSVKLTAFSADGLTELAALETHVQVVPEPTSLALLGFGGLALLRRRR